MWRPILDGPDRQRAEAALAAITADLVALDVDWGHHGGVAPSGLNVGRTGVAVFLAYHANVSGRAREVDLALDLLDRSIEEAMSRTPGLSLSDGLTGVAWAVSHLCGGMLPDQDGDPVAAVDHAVAELLADDEWEVADELLYGLAGYGIWALERLPAPVPATVLERIVARLVRSAEVVDDVGVAWSTRSEWLSPEARIAHPTGRIDLGVAHGVTGIIGFLARAVAAGIGGPPARDVLDRSVAWLLTQRAEGFGGSTMPPYVGFDLRGDSARTAWCYGDLGVAAALLAAARNLHRADWEVEAVALARTAAARDVGKMRLMGTGICHGTAGAAHLFHRMYQATGDPELVRAARRWFRRTLDERRPGAGVGGFGAHQATSDGGLRWWGSPALIDGAAGVGLALLSGLEPVPPGWDRVLAVAVPVEG